jgi:3-(3-hydroxy-phenyl)propionate hydroxylase
MSVSICVVGAGPVGVVAALACARHGMEVTLLESAGTVDRNPRAATTHPATLEILAKLGLLEEFQSVGLVARYFQFWDGLRGAVAQFDHELLRGETPFPYVVQTEQHKLCEIGFRRLAEDHGVEVRWRTPLTGIEQDAREVRVRVDGPAGTEEMSFDYVIACDGGRSTVRKELDIEFEGYTWPERFMVLSTRFDFEQSLACCYRNYLSGAGDWANLFKVSGDDLAGYWRVVMPASGDAEDDLSDDAVRSRLDDWFPRLPLDALTHRNIYRVHQRVAKSFRSGRVFLAGDAAHVNNPIGGLGLNCGIHEAWDLANLLAEEKDLDGYEKRRRPLNIRYVQEQTVANKKRLEQRRFDELRETALDPERHKAFLMRASLLESARAVS